MYSKLQLTKKYLQFYITASNGKGHGIHSPFVFDFVEKVLNDKKKYPAYSDIEKLRIQLLRDHAIVELQDFGAGSAVDKSKTRKISDIVRSSVSSIKQSQLLFRIVNHYQPEVVIEFGTSLGISAAYMASANRDAKLITMEGSTVIADIAAKNFEKLGLDNIQLIKGNFDETLPALIRTFNWSAIENIMVYIDGNHRKEPTLRYYHQIASLISESSFIVLDDIHWSAGMEEAWEEIKKDERAMLTIDLFFVGLVFFKHDFKIKQNFKVRI